MWFRSVPGAWSLGLLAVASLAVGCGSDDDGSSAGTVVTCEWLASDQDCWHAAVREADTCFGALGATERGTFNAARNACTYQDGRQVRFTSALPAEVPDGYNWNYDVLTGTGATCLAFRSDDRDTSIETASGRVVQSSSGLDLLMTCPSGEKFRMTAAETFRCLFELPGSVWSSSGEFVSVSVLGGGEGIGEFAKCGPEM